MKKYKLSTRISAYVAVILSLAMSGLTIRSLIVKRNAHSVSVTLYGIVFVLLLVVSAVSLIVYIYKSKIGIYVSIACLVIIFAYGIIMKDSPWQLIIIFLPVIYAMFSTREWLKKFNFLRLDFQRSLIRKGQKCGSKLKLIL